MRLLLPGSLGLGARTSLSLAHGLTRRGCAADLCLGRGACAETRLPVLSTTLRVLAEAVVLRRGIPAERALRLRRQGVLLPLRTLLLTEILAVVVVAVLVIRRVVRGKVAGGGAEGATRLLLARRLCRRGLALEAALELVLGTRSNALLLAERLERFRGGERSRFLRARLTEATILLGALRGRRLDGCWRCTD